MRKFLFKNRERKIPQFPSCAFTVGCFHVIFSNENKLIVFPPFSENLRILSGYERIHSKVQRLHAYRLRLSYLQILGDDAAFTKYDFASLFPSKKVHRQYTATLASGKILLKETKKNTVYGVAFPESLGNRLLLKFSTKGAFLDPRQNRKKIQCSQLCLHIKSEAGI